MGRQMQALPPFQGFAPEHALTQRLRTGLAFLRRFAACSVWSFSYQLSIRMRNRVTPPEMAPKVAPFLPPAMAPTAVAIPAVAAIIKVSFSQDWRLPPPHNTIPAFISTSQKKILSLRSSTRRSEQSICAALSSAVDGLFRNRQVRPQTNIRGVCNCPADKVRSMGGPGCRGTVEVLF
jgi:hypothetical protein